MLYGIRRECQRGECRGNAAVAGSFPAGEDPIVQVAVDGTRVFVAGKGPNIPGASTGWLVRAYDPRTGTVLWHDVVTGFSGADNKANTVVAKGNLVFTGGFTSATVNTESALIRTYDARTGALRWQDRFDLGSFFTSVNQIAVGDDEHGDQARVFAVGRGVRADANTEEWFVRAYDARTGIFLWQDVLDDGVFTDAVSVATHDGQVFVAGFTTDPTIFRHFIVRAYDARNGALLWQDKLPSGLQGFFGSDGASQVVATDHRVVAVGVITDTMGYHFAVRTYDASSGSLGFLGMLAIWHLGKLNDVQSLLNRLIASSLY
jgi:outer membrane protein assembly factor BamB